MKNELDSLIEHSKPVKDSRIITRVYDEVDLNLLRNLSDIAKQKGGSCAVIFAAQSQDRASLIIALTDDLVQKGLSAHDLVKKVSVVMQGSGEGGRNLRRPEAKKNIFWDRPWKRPNA